MQDRITLIAATALGGWIGAHLALTLFDVVWLGAAAGALAGGIVGWLVVVLSEPGMIRTAIRVSYEKHRAALGTWSWRKMKLMSIIILRTLWSVSMTTSSLLIGIGVLTFPATLVASEGNMPSLIWALALFGMYILCVTIVTAIIVPRNTSTQSIRESIRSLRIGKRASPLNIYIRIPLAALMRAYAKRSEVYATIARSTYRLGTFLAGVFPFLLHIIVLIHSKLALIALCDSALGALVGWWLGNEIYGAIGGAVLGILNYEIVSVRILKIVPRRMLTR